ncbi:MAG: ribonuclease HII [Candidatus Eiseniibacteriota bacterium]
MPDFTFELAAGGLVAGVDEAGRGPWAGPVVAAAAILDADRLAPELMDRIDDSKKLRPAERVAVLAELRPVARIAVGAASVEEIDRLNILEATFLAMTRAVAALGVVPDLALVDGNRLPALPCRAQAVVDGDALSLSIAAASIAAKVTRDTLMARLALRYPGFGWERNAGYGTAEHAGAIQALGVTRHHRRSFAPVAKALNQNNY